MNPDFPLNELPLDNGGYFDREYVDNAFDAINNMILQEPHHDGLAVVLTRIFMHIENVRITMYNQQNARHAENMAVLEAIHYARSSVAHYANTPIHYVRSSVAHYANTPEEYYEQQENMSVLEVEAEEYYEQQQREVRVEQYWRRARITRALKASDVNAFVPDNCGICLEQYTKVNSVTTSCGHTFCKPCFDTHEYMCYRSDVPVVKCPMCRNANPIITEYRPRKVRTRRT